MKNPSGSHQYAETASCAEAMDTQVDAISSAFSKKTSIKDIFKIFPLENETLVDNSKVDVTETATVSMDHDPISNPLVPTVFKWKGGGNDISISGTFNNWEQKIPLARNKSCACIILNLPPGEHEYKFFIDGAWYHDPTMFQTKNNIVTVKPEDSDVLEALDQDIANSKPQAIDDTSVVANMFGRSPPGDYCQVIPPNPELIAQSYEFAPASSYSPLSNKVVRPPVLPPQLSQGLLNRDTDPHCDPNLLPSPNHVIVNHLYALSIKVGLSSLVTISFHPEWCHCAECSQAISSQIRVYSVLQTDQELI
ncbi:5'-AMP-activated protein kinase subunit beta-2 [Cichlidogyrus casuarinus]|uniref:5'-AMP-activated protein kinase subunit beta-1 n=1 Tax=Cichlidogyrus casuarinus TaxID=1844966 RepID=A0ABD2QJX6_9PLAT